MIESFLKKNIPEFQYPFFLITCFAFAGFGFSINLVTLLVFFLSFLVKKYPYSLDGLVGLIPKINTFLLSRLNLFLFISLFNLLGFSIK